MPKNTTITPTVLKAALRAAKRTGPVLSAQIKGDYIILHLCGDKKPIRWKPPARIAADRPVRKKKASKPKTFAEG